MAPPEKFGIEIEQFAGRSDGMNEGRQRVLPMIKVFDEAELVVYKNQHIIIPKPL